MSDTESDTAELMAALEHFVVDNDDLLELEERIGRFNIFDALGVTRAEIRHSNFLAWLLDPAESHGQGSLFLRGILMDLMKRTRSNLRAISPVELDGAELAGVIVRREWRNIDLLIECEEPNFVVAIENKVDSGEHSDQLQRYKEIINGAYPARPCCFVFLTPDGTEASDEDWAPYSYGDIHRALTRVRNTNESSIGDDVLAFLDHYLRLIGSRFMDDPKIDELCQRIYKNHRQAIELIYERVGSPGSALAGALESMLLDQDDLWHVFGRTSGRVDFVPKSWLEWIPSLYSLGSKGQYWIRLWFELNPTKLRLYFEIGPIEDKEMRRSLITALWAEAGVLGLGKPKKITDTWTRLMRLDIGTYASPGEADIDALVGRASRTVLEVMRSLSRVPEIAMPVLARASVDQ